MTTVVSRLYDHARHRAAAPAYAARRGGDWIETSWEVYAAQVQQAGRALIGLGVAAGGTVGILGFNRPEWAISCLGAIAAGGVPVGIYQTCAPNQIGYILGHAETRVVVVENAEQWRKVREVRGDLPHLEHVVMMCGTSGVAPGDEAPGDETPDDETPGVVPWNDFMAGGRETPEAALEERHEAIRADHLGTLIYTSGTTGTPKAVMLTHSNLLETAKIGGDLHALRPGDRTLSYLPLAHIAEQMVSIHMATTIGYEVFYAESIDKLAENLLQVQPTIFFGVPRVWERMHAAVLDRIATAPPLRRRLARWALAVGGRRSTTPASGGRRSGWPAIESRWSEKLVLSKIKRNLGLSQVRLAASGAAPIPGEVLGFFAALGIAIQEVYGLSETSGPGTWNHAGLAWIGTVGPPLPGVEVRLADDGEILFRGPNVFAGYFKDPEATAEALREGWLHTGDIGQLDADGCLTITGRKKELIITSGGKNIAPVGIEAALKQLPLVGEAMVIGDRRRYLTALLTLEPEATARFAAEHRIEGEPHRDATILAALQRGVDGVNRRLARVESVRRFRVLPSAFSVEEGELTPTLKLRRQVVAERYAEMIEEMYAKR